MSTLMPRRRVEPAAAAAHRRDQWRQRLEAHVAGAQEAAAAQRHAQRQEHARDVRERQAVVERQRLPELLDVGRPATAAEGGGQPLPPG